jgi:hypothetical protein
MTFFSVRKLFQYFLPATLTVFMLVTFERNIQTDIGGYDRLYGFPLAFISSNYAFTNHHDVYVLMMLVDLLFYFAATLLFVKILDGLGTELRTHWTLVSVGIFISVVWVLWFALVTFESTFKFVNDVDYKTTSTQIHFGVYPK